MLATHTEPVRVHTYVYDGAATPPHVEAVLERLAERPESVDLVDVDDHETRRDGRREAMLAVKAAVRVGSAPDALFGEDGRPDFSTGALVTEAETGRRSLHVGPDALAALQDAG